MKLFSLLVCIAVYMVFAACFMSAAQAEEENQPPAHAADKKWVVYYGSALSAREFDDYDIIVFDRDKHPPIQNLKAKGKILLGYVSVGEAEKYRPDYEDIKATHALLEEKPQLEGALFRGCAPPGMDAISDSGSGAAGDPRWIPRCFH